MASLFSLKVSDRNQTNLNVMSRNGHEQALRLSAGVSKGLLQVSLESNSQMSAWFYILRLQSGALYVGATKDLTARYKEHCIGKACRTTSIDPPVDIVYSEKLETFPDARKREAQVKRWTRAKKEALIDRDLEKLKLLSKSYKIREM